MTIQEAIGWFESKLIVNERFRLLGNQNEAAKLALAALREQEERMSNQPLTLEELREMDGEPVYCVRDTTVGVNGDEQEQTLHSEEWGIVASRDLEDCGFIIGSAFVYHTDTYGKTWLAYRQKPAEVKNEAD